MDEEGLIRVCVSAFSSTDIDVAKVLLYKSISTSKRNVSRRKDKEQRDESEESEVTGRVFDLVQKI